MKNVLTSVAISVLAALVLLFVVFPLVIAGGEFLITTFTWSIMNHPISFSILALAIFLLRYDFS